MGVIVKSTPEIIHAIVGTAGHVDHGKTSLVKLLTGCDTDRLPEEKARGMSIDLGFAPCQLRGRRVVGIVDVPGHKDFIRNMVAGATSIDVLMLVVAADDGVMPQTDEHVKIIRLLRSPQVMVALTKIDMVEPEMLELAKQDVQRFMAQMGYPDAPIIPVSNKTGEGVGEVRNMIDQLVEKAIGSAAAGPAKPASRAFRMNVERVFAVKGYGTVVTGIPVSGKASTGDRLELLPSGEMLTIRTIQSYKHDSDSAYANCCCAINVRDIEPERVLRGMTVAWPDVYSATKDLVVLLENAANEPLKRRMPVMLHTGTAAVEASIKLLDLTELRPGQEAIAHIALAEPLAIAAGDRFIIRAPSPPATLGGGIVLSTRVQRIKPNAAGVLERLDAAARASDTLSRYSGRGEGEGPSGNAEPAAAAPNCPPHLITELLAGPDAILPAAEMIRLTQCAPNDAPAVLRDLQSAGVLVDLGGSAWAIASRMGEVAHSMAAALERYHKANPYAWGMAPAHVCEHLGLEPKNFDRLAKLLSAAGPIAVKHGRLALKSFEPPVSAHLLALRDRVLNQIRAAAVNGIARGNVIKELSIGEKDMQVLTQLLVEDGTVLFLDGNFILRSVYDECRSRLLALFSAAPRVDLGAFRDAIASNRKMAVAMLDAFDGEGLTRRMGDARVLVKSV